MCTNTSTSAAGTSLPESAIASTARSSRKADLLTPAELASELGVGLAFIRKLAYERRLPVVKVGRYVRFNRHDVDQWLEQHTRPARAGG
jgi:excisionase family DNA binding protein